MSHSLTHTPQDALNSPEGEETGLERWSHKPKVTQWVWTQAASLHSLPWSPEKALLVLIQTCDFFKVSLRSNLQ